MVTVRIPQHNGGTLHKRAGRIGHRAADGAADFLRKAAGGRADTENQNRGTKRTMENVQVKPPEVGSSVSGRAYAFGYPYTCL